jgi:hypothetical protein
VKPTQSAIRQPIQSRNLPEPPALEDPSAEDPVWMQQRQSKTRFERIGYFSFAAALGCFGAALAFIEGEDDSIRAVFIGVLTLMSCGYYLRKAWIRQRMPSKPWL